jgi:hypothetical protein
MRKMKGGPQPDGDGFWIARSMMTHPMRRWPTTHRPIRSPTRCNVPSLTTRRTPQPRTTFATDGHGEGEPLTDKLGKQPTAPPPPDREEGPQVTLDLTPDVSDWLGVLRRRRKRRAPRSTPR